MAVEYWKAPKDIHDKVKTLVASNHPDLVMVVDEIAVVFREKAGKSGGQVVLGNSKKVAPLANALANENYTFVLELAADQWEGELSVNQREALLDHLLTACRCEEDPKSGEVKCSIAKPDISAFRENIERYGMWFPKDEDEEQGPDPVREMFGKDDPGGDNYQPTKAPQDEKVEAAASPAVDPDEDPEASFDDLN